MSSASIITERLPAYVERVNAKLTHALPQLNAAHVRLHLAMHYSVMNGGKRMRPMLVYATGEAVGSGLNALDHAACAVELVHAYSLIHDDLPAMDDDDLRRGQPTCHKQFDEATAILAGDALQALSFKLLCEQDDSAPDGVTRLKMMQLLGDAVGSNGMALGQAIDLESAGQALDLEQLKQMHRYKTGALIGASVQMGAISNPNLDTHVLAKLERYAEALGLAFQITDDILDVVADTATLGKPQHSDARRNKPTYPALLGLEGARQHAQEMSSTALDSLDSLPASYDTLRALAQYVIKRTF